MFQQLQRFSIERPLFHDLLKRNLLLTSLFGRRFLPFDREKLHPTDILRGGRFRPDFYNRGSWLGLGRQRPQEAVLSTTPRPGPTRAHSEVVGPQVAPQVGGVAAAALAEHLVADVAASVRRRHPVKVAPHDAARRPFEVGLEGRTVEENCKCRRLVS